MIPIDAVQCADMLSDKLNINIGDLVDLFAEIPTLDVVPREEVDKAKNKGATEALVILYKELIDYHEKIKNDYMELPQKSTNTARFRGESYTVDYICNMILKLKKKYTEDAPDGKRTDR